MNAKVSNLQASYVLAYGVSERKDGPIIALKYDREDASNWIVSASSEYRNQQMPGPSYHIVELIDRTAAVPVEALEGLVAELMTRVEADKAQCTNDDGSYRSDAHRAAWNFADGLEHAADKVYELIKERSNG